MKHIPVIVLLILLVGICIGVVTRVWFTQENIQNPDSSRSIDRPARRWPSYMGILLGATYGMILRLLFDKNSAFGEFFGFTLFSITFIWIVPVVIGIFPLWFASNIQLRSRWYALVSPLLAVFTFFAFALLSRVEDILCLLVIAAPFLFGAMVAGALIAPIILRYRRRKGIIVSIALFPLVFMVMEKNQSPVSIEKQVTTVVIINATPGEIWKNIVRVSSITDDEYVSGPFQWAGVPRPLRAELDHDSITGHRIGYFEGGLQFDEKVTKWEAGKLMQVSIEVVPNSIRSKIFDRHVLQGNHFGFLAATYQLRPVDAARTELTLSCDYRLTSHINEYSSLWGKWLIGDFQQRLLEVIKKRCEIN